MEAGTIMEVDVVVEEEVSEGETIDSKVDVEEDHREEAEDIVVVEEEDMVVHREAMDTRHIMELDSLLSLSILTAIVKETLVEAVTSTGLETNLTQLRHEVFLRKEQILLTN